MDDSHYHTLLNESCAVYRPDGSPLMFLLKKAIDPQMAANAWASLKSVNSTNKNRSVAIGTPAKKFRNQDGRESGTSRVPLNWAVVSDIIGFFDRSTRLPFARACAWNSKHPERFARIFPMLEKASDLFKKTVPERYANQLEFVNKTHSDWIIPGTVYTTVTVNKNFRTAAHKDAGDLESGFSNMITLCEGKFTGGNLVLPNWQIAAKLDNLDLILFDAHEFHGNTQIAPRTKSTVRCTLVCYYREKMIRCKSAEYELDQAKNRKIGQPIYWETE